MLARPTNRTIEALAMLQGGRFDDVIVWLEKSLSDITEQLIAAQSESQMRQLQGAASVLKELLDHTKKACDIVRSKN